MHFTLFNLYGNDQIKLKGLVNLITLSQNENAKSDFYSKLILNIFRRLLEF